MPGETLRLELNLFHDWPTCVLYVPVGVPLGCVGVPEGETPRAEWREACGTKLSSITPVGGSEGGSLCEAVGHKEIKLNNRVRVAQVF